MSTTRLQELFGFYYTKTITAEQKAELMTLIGTASKDELGVLIMQYGESLTEFEPLLSDQAATEILEHILNRPVAPVRKLFNWKRIAVAASILLVIGLGSYFTFFNKSSKPIDIADATPKDVKAPAANRAMITLADGRTIYLDSAVNGTLTTTGNVTVTKNERGEIVYNGAATTVEYNTLFNPRGSRVQPLTLSDGTTLWLNAESSVTYPTAFVGKERKVSITGEAYFEVAHDATRPFFVSKNDVSIQVLGTHFNVNAYDGENDIKITLLEGSVKVNNSIATGLLKPGEQAQVTTNIKVVKGVDIAGVMAWKNGFFQFNGLGISEVMHQLERWYDVSVRYEGKIPEREFAGQIDRNANLSEVLSILKESNVHVRLEGKNLIVTP